MSSNIKVAIRVRPLISREKNDKLKEQWEVNENSIYPIDVGTGKRYGDAYYFDHIFHSTCCNADIYNTVVHPVVDKAMNGFNGTVFAYGQTSSGKTYTMMGNAQEDGLISKAVQNIFLAIEHSVNRKFLLRVSYMEIYNEKIYDLLDIKNIVKISEDYSGSVLVNVKEEVTDCAEKVYDMMKQGDKARRIGETHMNEKSSRSHTIFRIIIESSDINDTGLVNVAHLNLVDLAGSERATHTKATGQRLKEGVHINKSLSTLSLVMKQLSESQDFINFRDSKLTRILQTSLGGNALTTIICAVTPAALEETHSTLAFASRAKTVKNRPLLNEVMTDEALINKYALEINKLKRKLEMANDNTTQQAQRIALLEKCIIYSKKTNNNKSRRKTWSAPTDCNRTLPVIYEADVLRLSDPLRSDKIQVITSPNIESEDCPYDEILDGDNSAPPSVKKKLSPWTTPQGKPNLSLRISKQSNKNGQSDSKKPENIKWLTNSSDTDTPKSVLRERAEYYEHEFRSLKELTTQEKILLATEFNSEIETLKAELDHTKNELECERKLRKDDQNQFFEEKKRMDINLEEKNQKIDELLKLMKKLKEENNIKNDCEYIAEMYKEKYKKREKELLDSLKEARDLLKSSTNNTDDEKNHVISSGLPTPSTMNEFLDKYKKLLNILKFELEANQPMWSVQSLFSELQKLNEELINNSSDCSEELQDLLNLYKITFELISLILVDNNQIHELETVKQQLQNRVAYFQNKEKTYELLVSKQDEEIKHLSENILQYMSELNNHKNEISRYKEVNKLDLSSQTELDCSTNTTMNENEDKCQTNKNETLTAEVKQFSEQYEEYKHQDELKTKQIEELTQKISSYVKQLIIIQEMYDTEKNQNEIKNKQIEELTLQISESNSKLSEMEEKIILYTTQLSDMNEINKTKIDDLQSEINSYNSTITEKEESYKQHLAELNDLYESEKKLNSNKDQRLAELTTNINVCNSNKNEMNSSYIKQLSDIQEKYESQTEQNETNVKIIDELTSQITASNLKLNEIVSSYEKKLVDIQKMYETEKGQNEIKSKRISELLSEIDSTNFKFLEIEEILSDIQIMCNDQKNSNEICSTKIEELILEMNAVKSALYEVKYSNKQENDDKSHDSNTVDHLRLEIAASNSKLKEAESSFAKQLSEIQIKYEIEKQGNKAKTDVVDKLILEAVAYNSKICEIEYSHDKQISEIQKKYEVEKQENEVKSKTIRELTLEVSIINSKLNEIESSYIKQISNLQKKYEDQKEENEEKNKKIQELSLKIDSCSDISSYIEQLSNIQEKYELVIQENESKDKKIDEYIKQLSDIQEKYETERQENDIKGKRNDELTAEDKVKLTALEEELQTYKAIVNENRNLEAINLEIIEELKNKILKDDIDLHTYMLQIQENENLLEAKDKQIIELNSKIVDASEEFSLIEKELESYKSNYLIYKDMVEADKEEIKSVLQKLVNVEKELNDIKSNKSEENKIIASKNEEIKELSSKNTHYLNELTSITATINKYEEDLKVQKKLVREKDTEIEELSVNIMDYVNQLSSTEEKVIKLEVALKSNDGFAEIKDIKIKELSSKIDDYMKQLSSNKETINSYETSLHDLEDLLKCKDKEIKELSANVGNYITLLSENDEKIRKYVEDLKKYDEIRSGNKEMKDLLRSKDKTINELTSLINECKIKLTSINNKMHMCESEVQANAELVEAKNTEIKKLFNEIDSNQKILSKYKSQLKFEQNQMILKDGEIRNLTLQLDDIKNNVSLQIGEINQLKSVINEQIEIINNKDFQINNLKEEINQRDKQLQILYEKNSVMKINICCQTDSFEEIKDIHLQSEIEDLKSKYNTTIREKTELNKKNDDYKKIVEKLTKKANTKFISYYNTAVKLKQDKELLKVEINNERTSNQALQSQLLVLKAESENKCYDLDVVKLQTKINKLEEQNKEHVKVIEDYREQLYTKSHEITLCKKSFESLKQDNQRLQNITKELTKNLHGTEEHLQSTRSNMQLLNKENENYSERTRLLEETLEDIKFELYELKNKEREKIKKEKRQSLHDSSRSLSSDEHTSIGDENKSSFDTKKADETKKQRQPLLEKQVDEQRQKFTQLQTEYDKLQKKSEQLTDLCKIRKHKIDELERKLKLYNQ